MEDDSKMVVTNILFGTIGDSPWGLDIQTGTDIIIRCTPITEFSSSQQRPYRFRFTARTPTDNFSVDILDQGNNMYLIRTDSHRDYDVIGGIKTNIIVVIPETLIDRLQAASHEFPLQQTLISLVGERVASGASALRSAVSSGAGSLYQGISSRASAIATQAPPIATQARQAAYSGASRAGQAMYYGASQAGQAASQAGQLVYSGASSLGQSVYSGASSAFTNVSAYLTPYSAEELQDVKEYIAFAKLYTIYYFPKGYDIVKLLLNKTPVEMFYIIRSVEVSENETVDEGVEAERKIMLGGKNATLVPFNSYPANLVPDISPEIAVLIRSARNRQELGVIIEKLIINDGVFTLPGPVRGRRGSTSR
jgi:hypothetical protein